MATAPQFAATPRSPQIQIVNSDGSSWKTLFTMGSAGGILKALWAVSDDTTARWITFAKGDGTTSLHFATYKFSVPVASMPLRYVNGLDPRLLTWLDLYDPQMHIAANQTILVRMETAVTADKTISVFAIYGEF